MKFSIQPCAVSAARTISLFVVLLVLAGCASRGLPEIAASGESPAARAVLDRALLAQGGAALEAVRDINVAYTGEWNGLVGLLQPVLIDAGFRQGSEERLLLGAAPLVVQQHRGPDGDKQVVRDGSSVRVSYNGVPASDADQRAAAALVADGYRLFLTGPLFFRNGNDTLTLAGTDVLDEHVCDLVYVVRRPGLGLAEMDRFLIWVERDSGLFRRIRFSLDGLASTQGAVAEVDWLAYRELGGVRWPVSFVERLKQPIPNLPVHRWSVSGLDINRGWSAGDVADGAFHGVAASPARPLPEK